MINVIKVDDFEKFTAKLEEIATAIQNMPTPTGGYNKTLLYDSNDDINGAPQYTSVNLLDNLSKYDVGILIISTPADRNIPQYQSSAQYFFDINYVLTNGSIHKLHWAGYGVRWMQIEFTDTTFTIDGVGGEDHDHEPAIYKIYGIKY